MKALATMGWLGRRILMDFGFGAILERFEKAFGARAVVFILALIGLAVVATCARLIWDNALGPAVLFLVKATEGATFWEALLNVFWTAAAWAGGIVFGLLVSGSFMAWKRAQQAARLLARAEAVNDQVEDTLRKVEVLAEVADTVSMEITRIREEDASKRASPVSQDSV